MLPDDSATRLAQELHSVSAKQTLNKMRSDLEAMNEWCIRYKEYGSRQGGLDIKYVSDRYSKGIARAAEFMSSKHKLVSTESFDPCQAEILQHCHALHSGNQPHYV